MTSQNIKKLLNSKNVLKRFKENNVKHLYLVGSYSRGEETENSDIDLIYEFGEGGCISGFGFIGMKLYLEEYLENRVDLVEQEFINKNLVKYLEKDKMVIF